MVCRVVPLRTPATKWREDRPASPVTPIFRISELSQFKSSGDSRLKDLLAAYLDVLRGVTCVEDHATVLHDKVVVICGVVCRDEDTVLARQETQALRADYRTRASRDSGAFSGALAREGHCSSTTAPRFNNSFISSNEGLSTRVVHVLLVGGAENTNLAPFNRLARVIQKLGQLADHVVRHMRVDFPGKFDEASLLAPLTCQPGQVKRVNRDTVSTQPRSRIKRLESERFRFGGVNHFPDVNPHLVVQHFQFIHHRDVDSAVGVFQDLRRFGDFPCLRRGQF